MNTSNQYITELMSHLLESNTPKELENKLHVLLTPSELNDITKRLQIFKLLKAGLPQRQIAKKLGVGIATVTRGSNTLKQQTET